MIFLDSLSITDKLLIAIVMQLFILSTISERITNFIKLNVQSVTTSFGNFKIREYEQEKEKKRERGVLNWAIIVGIIVALCAKADLFYLINHGELKPDWNDISWLGCLLTGFFISLGSKFWHDLLDLLLQVKNLKAKLNDVKDLEIGKIEEFDSFMAVYESDLIRKVLDERHGELFGISGVLGVGIRSDEQGFYCEVTVDSDAVTLPQNYVYNYPPGHVKFLRIKKIHGNGISIMADKFKPRPGEEIGITATDLSGTLGCLVKYNQSETPVWLTCYHVVKSQNQIWEGYNAAVQVDLVEQPNNVNKIIGRVREAKRNIRLDIALVEPFLEQTEITPDIIGIGKVTLAREVTSTDEKNKTAVKKFGKNTGLTHGQIDTLSYAATINYHDGKKPHTLFNLIRIKPLDASKPFSRPGDSGSLVVDNDNQAIGMIVAGSDDGMFSYAMPISSIFNEFSLKF
jgi:hypothetical protein